MLAVVALSLALGAAVWGEAPAGALRLADAPKVELQTLDRLLSSESWPRRALAAMRLERFECAESREHLQRLLADDAWQVRAFAVRALGRRRHLLPEGTFDDEDDPRVLRAALRYRYPADRERVGRGVRYLARSGRLEQKMLAVELGAASGDDELVQLATETARTIILRMGRGQAGALSPRLAAVTGQPDLRRTYLWQKWLRQSGRRFCVLPAHGVPESADVPVEPGWLARLEPEQFTHLERYIEDLSTRSLDLAICLDCTASMSGELAEAQGGIDDLMLFAGDVVDELRVAIVAYRDRRSDFETRAIDFTSEVAAARRHLWALTASGGGDRPEAVEPALRLAFTRLTWMPENTKVLILVGDAPPHAGYGTHCVEMAERARNAAELTTHVIQAEGRPVKHFPEIAEAGGGRCLSLGAETDSLIVEIAGLSLGGRFGEELREFFRAYLQLCR